jgi:hypothetical protein
MSTILDILGYDPGLPSEPAAALIEFHGWSRAQLLIEQHQSTPTEPPYHYTGEDSLRGILAKRRLWCFNHLHQSDPSEFEYALAVARRVIKESAPAMIPSQAIFAPVSTIFWKRIGSLDRSTFIYSA